MLEELQVTPENVLHRASVSPAYLVQLLAAMSLCGTAQIKVLIWLDEKDRAAHRAENLFSGFRKLAQHMPGDVLCSKLGDATAAAQIGAMTSDVRLRLATIPDMVGILLEQDVHGREYLELIEAEEREPLLLLSTAS